MNLCMSPCAPRGRLSSPSCTTLRRWDRGKGTRSLGFKPKPAGWREAPGVWGDRGPALSDRKRRSRLNIRIYSSWIVKQSWASHLMRAKWFFAPEGFQEARRWIMSISSFVLCYCFFVFFFKMQQQESRSLLVITMWVQKVNYSLFHLIKQLSRRTHKVIRLSERCCNWWIHPSW